jgi:Nif-specific regulatory protein
MTALFEMIRSIAPTGSTVLVTGESGTGKEMVSKAIHSLSPRREAPFVSVYCGALPNTLLESELFGHKRGAFTGAVSDRKGMFEVADGGTLFLDEISETSVGLQAKLLRVLQEGEVRPVGETQSHKVDVRVVAATNRNLRDELTAGRFREDLYFRLSVFPLVIPPLRERRDDIPVLARHLTRRLAAQLKKRVEGPTPEALALLSRHDFPGNVRELANEIERAILLADPGAPLSEDLLSDTIQRLANQDGDAGLLQQRTDDFEREQIRLALERSGGVKTRAADELGITYRGLLKKMKRLGMI